MAPPAERGVGAVGVWLGFPLADPIIGLLITVAIFAIVWQSSKAVLTRMLDGVEPGIVDEIHHAAEHVPGIERVQGVQARWIGHRLHADVAISVADAATTKEVLGVTEAFREELFAHLPALSEANIRLENPGGLPTMGAAAPHVHDHHATAPFTVACELAVGTLEIVDTPAGERMCLTVDRHAGDLTATVIVERPNGPETLRLEPVAGNHHRLQSTVAPMEAHEFQARLVLAAKDRERVLQFKMVEPEGHHHLDLDCLSAAAVNDLSFLQKDRYMLRRLTNRTPPLLPQVIALVGTGLATVVSLTCYRAAHPDARRTASYPAAAGA
ncbi:hypothetical protein MesoLj113a_18050 [Mesorhizobium sp. 113-1-2]|nr:hypothetical protein MesoLj113a_18050 [Mesorhizobium sp. 113-1-2]